MKKLHFSLAMIALLALKPLHAHAAMFDWSYTDGGTNIGSGTFTATPQSGDGYLVTGVTGTANGLTITGLSSYDGPDQLVFSPSPPDIALDSLGVSFNIGAQAFNIYEDDGLYATTSPFYCGSVYCLLGPGTVGPGDTVAAVDFTLTPSAVPLPAALPLFATSLGMLGFVGWRRKKSAAAP